MSSLGSALRRAAISLGSKAWNLFRRHPAATTMGILAVLALGTGYRMWREGFPGALGLLPSLAIYLGLFVAIWVARRKIRELAEGGLTKGSASVGKAVAREVVDEGVSRGGAILQRGVNGAKGALSSLAQEAKGGWEHRVEGKPRAPLLAARGVPRCRACGRSVRSGARYCDGCGAALPLTCPQCGRPLRGEARFCDGCGASAEPSP